MLFLFFLGIFCYVGTEQGISYWMAKFLHTISWIRSRHCWCKCRFIFLGSHDRRWHAGPCFLKLFDSKLVLRWFTILGIMCLRLGLWGSGQVSLWAFPIAGFFLSVMFPVIVSLGLNSVSKHHGSFAGILMTGIAGGAVVQLLIGWISDLFT